MSTTPVGKRSFGVRRNKSVGVVLAFLVAIGLTVVSQGGGAPNASATYSSSLCGGVGSWHLAPYSYNSTWMTAINNARASWNSHAALNIYTQTGSGSSITVASYADTWYGLYSYPALDKRVIKINSRTISRDATNFANFSRSTVAHEFGHGFCLIDNPNTTSSSLMKHSRNRNTLYAPTSYDWADINANY